MKTSSGRGEREIFKLECSPCETESDVLLGADKDWECVPAALVKVGRRAPRSGCLDGCGKRRATFNWELPIATQFEEHGRPPAAASYRGTFGLEVAYLAARRRRATPRPIRPALKSARVAGSGTAAEVIVVGPSA